MRRLAEYTALSTAAFAGYHWLNPFPETTVNQIVAAEITVVASMCVITSVVWTRHWRVLSVGLLGVFIGVAMAFYPPATDGTFLAIRETQRSGTITTPHWYIELFRTLLATGFLYVAFALVRWARLHRHEAFPYWRDGDGDPDPFETGETA